MSQTISYDRNADGTLLIKLMNVTDEGKEVADSRSYDCTELPEEIQTKSLVYGVSKLCAERTSDTPPSDDKLNAIDEVFQSLLDGNWERERKKGTGPTVRIEVEALAALRGCTVKQVQTLLKKYDKEQQESIFAHEDVVAKVEEMKADMGELDDDANLDDLISA